MTATDAQVGAAGNRGNVQAGRRQMSDGTLIKLFILPTLILLIVWNIFPLFYSLYLSFTRFQATSNQPPIWVGLDNYANIFADTNLWRSFTVTGRYALLSVAL